jgi:hypothetical protein
MLFHCGFPELVYYVRLERLGEGLAICSNETVAAHWVDEPVAKDSSSASSDVVLESSVVGSGMEDVVHASTGEPYSGFRRKALIEASEAWCCFLKTVSRTIFSSCHSSPSL